jgi:hypothetical protein
MIILSMAKLWLLKINNSLYKIIVVDEGEILILSRHSPLFLSKYCNLIHWHFDPKQFPFSHESACEQFSPISKSFSHLLVSLLKYFPDKHLHFSGEGPIQLVSCVKYLHSLLDVGLVHVLL